MYWSWAPADPKAGWRRSPTVIACVGRQATIWLDISRPPWGGCDVAGEEGCSVAGTLSEAMSPTQPRANLLVGADFRFCVSRRTLLRPHVDDAETTSPGKGSRGWASDK